MNSEREIVKKLFESKYMNEKTYTVGDTQYWKRGGKCYKWTSSGGRAECSEDEYYKAISGGKDEPVKNTEPSKDKSKHNEPKLKDDFTSAIENSKNPNVNMNTLKRASISGSDGNNIHFEDFVGLFDKGNISDTNRKALKANFINKIKKLTSEGRYDNNITIEAPKGDGSSSTRKYSMVFGWHDKEVSKKQSKPEPDHTESDYINHDGVRNFDHTTWDIDGYETTIQKNPYTGKGYYLQNDDYDMEFDTKGDLVDYLKRNKATFAGYDSSNDY